MTTRAPGVEQGVQVAGQGEVAQKIDAKLEFVALGGSAGRGRHHGGGVVHQHMELRMLLPKSVGELLDLAQASQIQRRHFQAAGAARLLHGRLGLSGPVEAATGQHHVRAGLIKGPGRFIANPGVGPGDKDGFAG